MMHQNWCFWCRIHKPGRWVYTTAWQQVFGCYSCANNYQATNNVVNRPINHRAFEVIGRKWEPPQKGKASDYNIRTYIHAEVKNG